MEKKAALLGLAYMKLENPYSDLLELHVGSDTSRPYRKTGLNNKQKKKRAAAKRARKARRKNR